MATVVDYEYIPDISTEDALKNSASDVTTGYNGQIPGVNTYKINAETSIYNEQGGGGSTSIAGWSADIYWTAIDYNTVRWSLGTIYMPNGDSYNVSMGNTGDMVGTTYIYYDMSTSTMNTTQNANDSVGENKLLMCVANPNSDTSKDATFQAFGTNAQSTFIYADNIAANTITANEIAANTITANEIAANTITSNKLNVTQLSAITGNMGDLYVGNINSGNGIKIYPYSSSQGRIQFYYNGSTVGYIDGQYNSGVGSGVVMLNGNYIVLDGSTYMLNRNTLDLSQAKLRIPVGDNLY